MIKIEPVLTEKSMKDAKDGKYTFRVPRGFNKYKIRELVEKTFGVNVTKVRTMREAGEIKRLMTGKTRIIKPRKKAIVTLKEKEKIDLFEEVK